MKYYKGRKMMKKIKWILVAAMVILSVTAWGCGERHGEKGCRQGDGKYKRNKRNRDRS